MKVRINKKMVQEWHSTDKVSLGYPAVAGMIEFTVEEATIMRDTLKFDLYDYEVGYGEPGEWRDMAAACKRQIANFEKALAA